MMEPPQCKAEYKCPEQRHIYDGSKEVGGLERYIAGEVEFEIRPEELGFLKEEMKGRTLQ